ncbi:hypothetical protein PUN28_003922 [Cardiocondyla obscurior]|uniref:Uncharacterized protein n=1 Tax=Cardiocondyla obscurior TaxID=286306 RepID=A0AAW2GN78_9HYME
MRMYTLRPNHFSGRIISCSSVEARKSRCAMDGGGSRSRSLRSARKEGRSRRVAEERVALQETRSAVSGHNLWRSLTERAGESSFTLNVIVTRFGEHSPVYRPMSSHTGIRCGLQVRDLQRLSSVARPATRLLVPGRKEIILIILTKSIYFFLPGIL